MSSVRVLHIDDEPDIREIVEIALGLDVSLTVQTCESGAVGLRMAAAEVPDIILLDVMMPDMDGPTMLAHLRESPMTANIPVVFVTARAQERELEHFRSLGAAGVISKPFDPMTLASSVRRYSQDARLAPLRASFVSRARKDAAAMATCRPLLASQQLAGAALADIRTITHGLAGSAGIYGFAEISEAAAALEQDVIAEIADTPTPGKVRKALDTLLALIECLADTENGETCTEPPIAL